jgi:hypothetical protein
MNVPLQRGGTAPGTGAETPGPGWSMRLLASTCALLKGAGQNLGRILSEIVSDVGPPEESLNDVLGVGVSQMSQPVQGRVLRRAQG